MIALLITTFAHAECPVPDECFTAALQMNAACFTGMDLQGCTGFTFQAPDCTMVGECLVAAPGTGGCVMHGPCTGGIVSPGDPNDPGSPHPLPPVEDPTTPQGMFAWLYRAASTLLDLLWAEEGAQCLPADTGYWGGEI